MTKSLKEPNNNVFNIKDGSPFENVDRASLIASKGISTLLKNCLQQGVDISKAFLVIPANEHYPASQIIKGNGAALSNSEAYQVIIDIAEKFVERRLEETKNDPK